MLRCTHCTLLLIVRPMGELLTAACSCGAAYVITMEQLAPSILEQTKVDARRNYNSPGSY